MSAAFTPRQVERLRPGLRGYLTALWRDIAPVGRCEVVTALARPLPSMAIAELLGVPGDDALLARWSASVQAVFDMDMEAKRAEIEAAYEEVQEYVLDLIVKRRQEPGDDLLSALVHHEQDGDRLSDDEIVTLSASVISGGTDTTESQLAHGLRLFSEHPDQWKKLEDDPAPAEQATQEVLRFEPRVPFTARLVAGAHVLSFGFGTHFCAGAHLARAELTEALASLAPRMHDLEPDGEPAFGTPTGIYTMRSLPLRFTPREPG